MSKKFTRIHRECVEDLRETIPLIQVATVMGDEMKRVGQQCFLDCPNPDHVETTRFEHFSLRPSKNIAKCFTCGISITSPYEYYAWRKFGKPIFSQDDSGKRKTNGQLFKESILALAALFGKEIRDEEGNILVLGDIQKQTDLQVTEKFIVSGLTPQPANICHAVYSAFLALCPLREHHAKELLGKRKYSVEEVKQLGFRSVPTQQEWAKIYQTLHSKGYPLERVPGFSQSFVPSNYRTDIPLALGEIGSFQDAKGIHEGRWFYRLSARNGYFIPIRDENGFIVRLRVRLDEGESKYNWFSSEHNIEHEDSMGRARKNGASSGAPLHIAVPSPILTMWKHHELISDIMQTHTVLITEGEHKANIVSNFFGIPVIGVPGVGAFEAIIPLVKKWGIKKLIIAYDADTLQKKDDSIEAMRKHKNLFSVLKNFANTVKQQDVASFIWTWNMHDGKGLDDLILNQKLPVEFNLRTNSRRPVHQNMVHEIL